jgi:hypothetical protein
MYNDVFKYPSHWTSSWDNYVENRDKIYNFISHRVRNRAQFMPALKEQQQVLIDNYLNANIMIDKILDL